MIDEIIKNADAGSLLALTDDEKEQFLWSLMYEHLIDMELDEMNRAQKTYFLAARLEDTCQADALPSLSEDEDVFLALPEMKAALEELGAFKTAELLGKFIALLPEGTVPEWGWFFEEERETVISELDEGIGAYPDGPMLDLYIKYISNPETAKEILTGIK